MNFCNHGYLGLDLSGEKRVFRLPLVPSLECLEIDMMNCDFDAAKVA